MERRRILRTMGVGAVGALLGVGVAQSATTATPPPNDATATSQVVLYGPDGRALPTFRPDDPGAVRPAGRGAATGYVQHNLAVGTAQTIRRAAGKVGIWIQVEHGEVRVRTDGADASATTGEVIGAGFAERYDVASLSVVANGVEAVIQAWSE